MSVSNFLQRAQKFEIQAYQKPEKSARELRLTHVSFSGSPVRHPYDKNKVVMIPDPCSTNTFYYEFKSDDISYVEKLPSLTGVDGEAMVIVRIWVRKKTVALRCVPFVVDDTLSHAP